MRVLIFAAFFACSAAMPSGIVAPYIYQTVPVPAAVPTISPGDIQAAAIDAQVKINDAVRATADKAIEIADQSVLNANEKIITDVSLANERTVEAFWSNEDRKWQTLDALKIAEAKIDGDAASKATEYAKSSIGGNLPYVAVAAPVAPFVAVAIPPPIPPVVYTPYEAAIKSDATQTNGIKTEDNKAEYQEAIYISATVEKSTEAAISEKLEASTEQSAEKPLVLGKSIVTPFSNVYDLAVAAGSQIVTKPLLNYVATQPIHGVLAPTVVKGSF